MSETTSPKPSQLIAFYGYKGGAGRSMLAANVASFFALSDRKVLLVDWDLEAPGIGDFLNFDPTKQVSSEWRQREGVYELLEKSAGQADAELEATIRDHLKAHALEVELTANKAISLLGPGSLRDGVAYAGNLMDSDWPRFLLVNAGPFSQAFRKVCAEEGYDTVIFDTRTGLNIATLYVLRYISDHVLLVSPKTHQALVGTHLVWQLLDEQEAPGAPATRPERSLILTRFRMNESAQSKRLVDNYLDAWEGPDPIRRFDFPHLPDIQSLEELFFQNERLWPLVSGSDSTTPDSETAVGKFARSLRELCRSLGLPELPKLDASERLRQSSRPSESAQITQSPTSGDELISALIESLRNLKPSEPQKSAENQKAVTSPGSVSGAATALIKYIEEAHPFERTTLWLRLSQRVKNEAVRFDVLSEDQITRLHLDTLTTPSTGKWIKNRADELWRDGLRLRDQEDDPEKALPKFQEAASLSWIHDAQPNASYQWEAATTLYNLARWRQGLQLLETMLHENKVPKGLEKADLWSLQLLFANTGLASAEYKEFSAFQFRELDQTADRLSSALRPGRENDDATLIADYRMLREQLERGTATQAAEGTISLLKDLIALYDAQSAIDKPNGPRLLPYRVRNQALLVRSGVADRKSLESALSYSQNALSQWFANPTGQWPDNAFAEVMTMAVYSSDCGNALAALDQYIDALQIINTYADRPSLRIPAIGYLGIIESMLGRPDLACETWRSLQEEFDKNPALAERYQTKVILKSLGWWTMVSKGEMGEAEEAWRIATEPKHDWEVKPTSKYNFDSFLPRIAFAAGHLDQVEKLAAKWEADLRPALFFDVDLFRRIAASRLAAAQARFCLLDANNASALDQLLSDIDQVLVLNHSGAEAFWSRYALMEFELAMFRMEVEAFSGRGADVTRKRLVELTNAWEVFAKPMLDDDNDRLHGWFFTDRIRISTGFAMAAAICRKTGENALAEEFVATSESHLAFVPDPKLAEKLELTWLIGLAEVPRSLVRIVKEGSEPPAAGAFKKHRYEKLIRQLCH